MKIAKILPIIAVLTALATISYFQLSNKKGVQTQNNLPEVQRTISIVPTSNTYSNETKPEQKQENKLCDWVDKSDIIIELSFANGVIKDTSYEAGFYYSSIGSDMRLARSGCNYRTGFSYSEMANKGAVQVGVRGYTDSNRRQLENEPISVLFDEYGKPNVSNPIKVRVLD